MVNAECEARGAFCHRDVGAVSHTSSHFHGGGVFGHGWREQYYYHSLDTYHSYARGENVGVA
jgi:hypothetical protein